MELEAAVMSAPDATRYIGNLVKDTVKSKAYWVDALSTIAVFQPIKFFNEMYFAGMSFEDALDVRKVGIPVALSIVRPMTKLRDKWAKELWNINKNSSKKRKIAADVSFVTAVSPLIYTTVLAAGGAELDEIMKAVPAGYLSTLTIGVPYARALDKIRDIFGTSPYEKEVLNEESKP